MALAKHNTTEDVCDVAGCDKTAERSLNSKQVAKTSLKLKDAGIRHVHLCKEHYKAYKKESKTDRELDSYYRWRYCSLGRARPSRRSSTPHPA